MGPVDGGMRRQSRAISRFIRWIAGNSARPAGGCLASARWTEAFGSMPDFTMPLAFCTALVLAAAFNE